MFNEGFVITKQKEKAVDIQSYRCSNPSCGKSFSKPLKALNLSLENPEPYLACPHCLMEITAQEDSSTADTKLGLDAGTLKTAKDGFEEEAAPQPTKALCTHHFGFLSERSSKEKIPEECMACAEIVNCMLKAVKSCTDN